MGMGRTQDVGPNLAWQIDVVGVTPLPLQEAPVFFPQSGLPKTKSHSAVPRQQMASVAKLPTRMRLAHLLNQAVNVGGEDRRHSQPGPSTV